VVENGSARFIAWEICGNDESVIAVGSKLCWAIRIVDGQRLDLRAEHSSAVVTICDLPRREKPIRHEGEKERRKNQDGHAYEVE
jgi:hypothetical protein